jgi:hypothetical protein
MKTRNKAILGYFAMPALVIGAMAILATPASAGNAYGKDGNPGKANGHAKNGGPASPNNGKGNLAAARGSLNAAHASANGLEHANPKSRVGMLALYMDAMVVYETAYEAISEEDWETYNGLIADIADIDADIAALQADIDNLDPEDPDYEADKQALEDDIADLEADKAVLQAEADAITAEVDAAADDAAGNLRDAANKDGMIDADVVHSVNDLLDGKSEDFTHSQIIEDSEQVIADTINPPE